MTIKINIIRKKRGRAVKVHNRKIQGSLQIIIKKSSIISYSREALEPIYKDIVQFAECEQLTAHANSIRVRFED